MTSNRTTTASLLTLCISLLVVGVVSGTVLRHVVQVVPVVVAFVAGLRRGDLRGAAAIPVFVFWLFIMALIWLYLLGIANIVSGTFPPDEIVLTVVIGLACVVGLGSTVRKPGRTGWAMKAGVFVAIAALQIGAMWLSFRPFIAER
jgi:hypothetical protein